jgi:hypothetical protein
MTYRFRLRTTNLRAKKTLEANMAVRAAWGKRGKPTTIKRFTCATTDPRVAIQQFIRRNPGLAGVEIMLVGGAR